MSERIGKLESKWTIVNGLSIHTRVSVAPVPVEDPAIVMVHGLVVSSLKHAKGSQIGALSVMHQFGRSPIDALLLHRRHLLWILRLGLIIVI
jgi:hypothetical protein